MLKTLLENRADESVLVCGRRPYIVAEPTERNLTIALKAYVFGWNRKMEDVRIHFWREAVCQIRLTLQRERR